MFKNVASQKISLFAFDTTSGAPKTGLTTGATCVPYVSKDYGTVTALGTATVTEMDATNAAGWYSFTLAQAETNGDALLFTAKSSTANVSIVGQLVFTDPPNYTTFSLDASGRVDAIKINSVSASSVTTINANIGATQPINFTGTAGSALVKSDTVDIAGSAVSATTAQLGVNVVNWNNTVVATPATAGIPDINVKNWNNAAATAITTNITGNLSGSVGSVTGAVGSVTGSVGSVTGAVGSVTGNVGGNVTGSVGSVVGAVGSVTGNVGGNVTGSVGSIATGGIVRASFAAETGLQSIRSNTAQAGAAASITLDAGASAVNSFYNNCLCYITGGTGVGQARFITAYVGATKVATVTAWATTPDATSTFAIMEFDAIPGAVAPTAAQVATAVWTDATGSDFTTANSVGKSLYNAFTANTSVYTVASLANAPSGGLTGAQIATAVWTDTTAGDFTTALSVGKSVMNGVALGTGLTVNDITTKTGYSLSASQTFNVTGNITGNLTGSVGSVTGSVGSVTGAVGSVTAGVVVTTNNDKTGYSLSSPQAYNLTGNITGNLSGSVGSVTGSVGSVTGAVGSVTSRVTANTDQISGNTTSATALSNSTVTICYGTCSGGSLTTAVVGTLNNPASLGDIDQLKGRTIIFLANTTTAGLRAQASNITNSTTGSTPTLTFTAMTHTPVNGDTFVVI